MIGQAMELQRGDVLVTSDGTEWRLAAVEVIRSGVRLHISGFPFPWLYGHNELVCYKRPELIG